MTANPVTDGNSALCTADSAGPDVTPVASRNPLRTLHSAITGSAWWGYASDLLRPPAVLAEQAPAVEHLRRYAHQARWTTSRRGLVRAIGIGWCYLVAVPTTVGARCWEWVWQRPTRALVVVATVKALTFLPPVGWAADHVIRPVIDAGLRLAL